MHHDFVALIESKAFRAEYCSLNPNFWRTNVQALFYILFVGFWSSGSSSQISSSVTKPGVEQDRNPLAGLWSFFTEKYVLVDGIIWRQPPWLNYSFGPRILSSKMILLYSLVIMVWSITSYRKLAGFSHILLAMFIPFTPIIFVGKRRNDSFNKGPLPNCSVNFPNS